MKRYKKWIIPGVIVVIAVVWSVMVYDVNKRFPQAEERAYTDGEWMELPNASVRAVDSGIYRGDELVEQLDKQLNGQGYMGKGNKSGIIVILEIKNISDEPINLVDVVTAMECEAAPCGWSNGPLCFSFDAPVLAPGTDETATVKVFYCFTGSRSETEKGFEEMKKNSFRLVKFLYPIKEYIEF